MPTVKAAFGGRVPLVNFDEGTMVLVVGIGAQL